MRIKAKVVSVDGQYATVLCNRKSACDGCHKNADGSSCSVCSLIVDNRLMQSRAYNACGACPEDIVEIETASSRVLGYAAVVFLLPIVMAIFGYWILGIWTQQQWSRLLFSAIMLVFTFAGIRIYSEVILKKRTDVTVVAVISPNDKTED